MVEFQWFLIALSVLPGSHLAIRAHRLPSLIKSRFYFLCASIIALSYYSVHLYFLISGFKWLCHLSLHCFPILPGRFLAIYVQFFAPCFITRLITSSSSYFVYLRITFYPWTFNKFRVQYFLPSMQALHISTIMKITGNSFPIFRSELINQLFELIILLLCPPSFLDVKLVKWETHKGMIIGVIDNSINKVFVFVGARWIFIII